MSLKLHKINLFCINIDQNGQIINARTSDMFQIDTLLNKNFFDLIDEEDKKAIHKKFFNIVNKVSFEEKIHCRIFDDSNSSLWYELTLSGSFDLDKLTSIHINFYNIDSLKNELSKSQEIQRSVVELSEKIRIVFFKYDVKQDKFVFINKQIFSLINLNSDVILQDSEVFFNLFGSTLRQHFIESAENNVDYTQVFKVKSLDNKEKQLKMSVYQDNYYDHDNSFLNGVLIDITDQELIKEQLIESKNSTELTSKNRFSLLAKSSHEIRTPLNGILGAVEILKLKGIPTEYLKWVDLIEQSSESLLTIINDILDFSKIDAGKMVLNLEPFDFKDIIHDSTDLFLPKCEKKNISIIIKNELTKKYVGDAGRIKQILINFLSNALKFSKTDIIASFYEKENKVYMSVKDFGKGISSSDQLKLFQFFSQLGVNEGSGLGLSICKSLANIMDGDIGVISEVGQGSEFWVLLPLPVALDIVQKEEHKEVDLNISASKRFLVAEDNETNISILKQIFSHLKLSADFVVNGQDALNYSREKKYDMIFMDCQMPIMDGLTATKHIRKHSLNEQTPIIALTAHAFEDYKEKCFLAGMTGFLSKPLKVSQLSETINQYIALDICNDEYDENTEDMMLIFRKNLHRDMQVILKAFQQGDFETVANKAHSMKSASLWVNLSELSLVFKSLEQESRNNDYNKTQSFVKQLRVLIEKERL